MVITSIYRVCVYRYLFSVLLLCYIQYASKKGCTYVRGIFSTVKYKRKLLYCVNLYITGIVLHSWHDSRYLRWQDCHVM